MTLLNITYQGQSCDYPLDVDVRMHDIDIKRLAVELFANGELPGISARFLDLHAFDEHIVDRFNTSQGEHIFLRPKVPFG